MSHRPALSPAVVDHIALSAFYAVSRLALWLSGFPFVFTLDWMWMCDPADLRSHLAETLFWYHAFPPGMNALTGVMLKVGGDDPTLAGYITFLAIGLMLANLLLALGRALGLPRWLGLALSVGFLCLPQSIYFEHLFHYEWPVVTLVVAAGVALHRAVAFPRVHAWSGFFALCAAIAVTRSTFHLVWFAAMIGVACWTADARGRRLVLASAGLPALILLGLYAKNVYVAGEFAASTYGPAALHLVTVDRLSDEERTQWMAAGRLSRVANISAYTSPRALLDTLPEISRPDDPPALTRLERPSVKLPDYNHGALLTMHALRRHDALVYISDRPLRYLANAGAGLRDFFSPTTEWHPYDRTAHGAHGAHRDRLGGYEALMNGAVHGWLARPIGLYLLTPLPLLWAIVRLRALRIETPAARARAVLVAYCVLQILWVVAASTLLTFRESARYRYQVEPLIWWLAAWAVMDALARRHHQSGPRAAATAATAAAERDRAVR